MTASWRPSAREQQALQRHSYVQSLDSVDAVWPWLADHHGAVPAVDAPHAAHPERFSFGELAQRIAAAAVAFRRAGVQNGDVVALFAENSPRWLVADQGLMRAGAADAVRGASAPVEELAYILEDCQATALVVQNAALWERLALTPQQRSRLRFVLQLEGEPADGVMGWEAFLETAVGQPSLIPSHGRQQVATLLYTSGTTGRPKGALLTHDNLHIESLRRRNPGKFIQVDDLVCSPCTWRGSDETQRHQTSRYTHQSISRIHTITPIF